MNTPEQPQPRLLEVGDVIYGQRYAYGFERYTISLVTDKRAYVNNDRGGILGTFKRECSPGRRLDEIGGGAYSDWNYRLATPELDARWAERQLRQRLTQAMDSVTRHRPNLTPDQCTALIEALTPFLSAQ